MEVVRLKLFWLKLGGSLKIALPKGGGRFLKYIVPYTEAENKEFRELMVPLTDMLREMGTEVVVQEIDSFKNDIRYGQSKPVSYIRLVIT